MVPSRDLARHDFFYAGQSKKLRMFKVKEGKVIWEYFDQAGRGEISDAMMMSDGNILLAHQYGIKEITADKEVVWSMDVPEGYEIHSIRPIGKKHVVYVQCGKPMSVVVMEIPSKKIVRQFELPYKSSTHGQNRSICLTKKGTLLIASMDLRTIFKYDSKGNQLNAWKVPRAWGVTELKNGNTLISNWWNEWSRKEMDMNNPPVRFIEVTPQGEIVWEMSSWTNPNLGPATTIQLLDEPLNRKKQRFGEFK